MFKHYPEQNHARTGFAVVGAIFLVFGLLMALIGSGIEAMQQISMVGNDLKLDNGVGVCGKEGQSLPVGVGQPTLKVDNLTVGGTA